MTNSEDIIGQALLGKIDKDTATARLAVQYAVQRLFFCQMCELALDQRHATLVESNSGTAILCEPCAKESTEVFLRIANETRRSVTLSNWAGVERIHPPNFKEGEDFNDPREKPDIPKAIEDAIKTVIDYLWKDEENDYAASSTSHKSGHVFESLLVLSHWIKY